MQRIDKPLTIEYHDEFEDVFVWRGLPGEFSKIDFFFSMGLSLAVFIYQFIEGERRLQSYITTLFILILLLGLYKGIKVGFDSVNYKKYSGTKITRLAESFLIWSKDDPVEIIEGMHIAIRPATETDPGVVYLYLGNEREIAFMADYDAYLYQFAEFVALKYNLEILETVHE